MPNKVYVAPESAVVFAPSGGTVTFTPTSLANSAGRVSAQWDRGAGSKPILYRWRAKTKAAAALAIGTRLEIYIATSDGSIVDGNVGTADAALSSADKRTNLQQIGVIGSDSTSNGETQQASGLVEIRDRYVSVVWYNALGQALTGTDGDHSFSLTPVPDEIQ